jgi:hypothetical protein
MTDGRAQCRLRAAKGKQKIGRFTEVFTTGRWLPRAKVADLTAPFGGRPKSRRRSAVRRERRSRQLDARSVRLATRMRRGERLNSGTIGLSTDLGTLSCYPRHRPDNSHRQAGVTDCVQRLHRALVRSILTGPLPPSVEALSHSEEIGLHDDNETVGHGLRDTVELYADARSDIGPLKTNQTADTSSAESTLLPLKRGAG